MANPLFRLQLLAAAVLGAAESDADARDVYTEIEARWEPFVEAFMRRHGLAPRPGITVGALVTILIAVGEGLALRELVDPTEGADRGLRLSLLGSVALALIAAATTKTEKSETIDEVVDRLLGTSLGP